MSKEQQMTNQKQELIEKIIIECGGGHHTGLIEIGEKKLKQILQDTLPDGKDIINQLNTLHKMELDTLACKSLKEFMKWVEERKSKKFTKDTLPSEQVVECERIYKSGVPRCSKCNSSLIYAEIYCTGCGAKIKRID